MTSALCKLGIFAILYLLVEMMAWGQPYGWQNYKVSYLPVISLVESEGKPVFGTGIPLSLHEVVQLEVVDFDTENHRHFERYATKLQVADERYQRAKTLFDGLKEKAATDELVKAFELYDTMLGPLLYRRQMADIRFLQAMMAYEQKRYSLAGRRFREAFIYYPQLEIRQGFYAPQLEEALRDAQLDARAEIDVIASYYPLTAMQAYARWVKADYVVVGIITGVNGRFQLKWAIYDSQTKTFVLRDTLSLAESVADSNEELSKRITRFFECHSPTLISTENSQKDHNYRWRIDLGYEHFVWSKFTQTTNIPQGPGFSLLASYRLTRELEVFGQWVTHVTAQDRLRDLASEFMTMGLVLGLGLDFSVGDRWHIALRVGLDQRISLMPLKLTRDVNCKHFGFDSERCHNKIDEPAGLPLVGVRSEMGVRLDFTQRWHLHFSIGLSGFFLDSRIIERLNFPIHANFGIGVQL